MEYIFEILSNPEFLAEGQPFKIFLNQTGYLLVEMKLSLVKKRFRALVDIYANWIPKEKILTTNVWSSELLN